MPRKPMPTTDDTDYEPPVELTREDFAANAIAQSPGLPDAGAPVRAARYAADEPVTASPDEPFPLPTTPSQQELTADRNGGEPEPQPKTRLRRGWSAANNQLDKNSNYAQAFKPEENVTYVIRFLEDEPYVAFNRHWVERPSQKSGRVRIPFTCLRSDGIDKPCPLCDLAGDAPKTVTSFNIAVVEKDGSVSLKSFDTTANQFRNIQNFARDELYSPLSRRWWAVKKAKNSRNFNEITLTPIMSDASLHDDYGYEVPDEADLKALDVYEADIVQVRSTSELLEIAKEMQAQNEADPYGDT